MDFETMLRRMKDMPWARQWRLLAGLALISVGILALAIWGFSPEYAPLYPSLPDKEGGAVMAALEQNGYTYKLGNTGNILVERSKIYEARYKLASQGVPKTLGDDSLNPPKFGASSSEEMAYQQKTKELELARTIHGISGVGGARVHLALPHQTIFGKETTQPTASVVLDSAGGISHSQAAAIAHLVANAVPGLKAADVSIVDGQGRLLSREDENNGDTPEQRAYVKEMRKDLQARVERLLEPLVGKAGAKAEIDVLLEFGNEESVTESWRPNSGEASIRSQQSMDARQGVSGASGIPGSSTNTIPLALPPLPGQTTTPIVKSEGAGTGTTQNTTNYELDRSVVKSIKKGVKIKKIRAAVLVDYKHVTDRGGKTTSSPLAPADLAKIQALVQESIGIDDDRGDTLQVLNMPFIEPHLAEESTLPIWKDPYWIEMGIMAIKWLLIIAGLLWLAKQAGRIIRDLATPETPAKAGANNTSDDQSTDAAARGVDINAIRQVAQNNPQAVASVIKGWVEGDGNE
jgi:flagellar M-ring protein FliF